MRRYSRPLTETRPHRYHVVHTTREEVGQWQVEDQNRALQHLEKLRSQGPLSPEQQEQWDRLTSPRL